MLDKKALEALLQSADPKQVEQLKKAVSRADTSSVKSQLDHLDSRTLDKVLRQFNVTDKAQKAKIEGLLGQVKKNPGLIDELKKKL